MLHLTYSNRTEALLEALGRDLAAWRTSAHPFDPVRLVVPNRNVEVWLKHRLARRDGIVANVETLLLRRFVAGLLEGPGRGVRLVDAAVLEDLVLSLLLDDDYLARPELDRVRGYLKIEGAGADAVDLRRVQLARVLGQLFEEYGFSRQELLAAWPQGPRLAKTSHAEIEAWQRRLWLDARALLARRAEAGGERWLQLSETLEAMPRTLGDGPVFFFGASYVARAFQRILGRIAAAGELFVYTLNPCAEFWEDIPAGWELRRPPPPVRLGLAALDEPDPFGFAAAPRGYPLLQRWGRPGRENIRLLNELADCDFQEAFEDPFEREPTLLHLVQRDVLRNEPDPAPPAVDLSADKSLCVLACPGVRREAEVIAGEIWRLVQEDEERGAPEPLRFNDVAVLVAGGDPESYFTHLAAAFQETFSIPFSVSDTPFASQSRVAEAVAMLLELPFGRFGRGELMRFVTHPAVAGRFGEVNPQEWIEWCEAVGIVHGADHLDHAGTYIDRDILNWDQGLRRLALGAVMTGARSGDERALELEARPSRRGEQPARERYLPEERGQGGQASAAHFGLLARSLIADLRFARGARLTAIEWGEFFGTLVEAYLAPRNESESRERDRCLRAVRSLGERRIGEEGVSCRVACELASAALEGLGGGHGQYLSRGVAVSTLQPMRAIPFRVVFVAGLGEGRFPAQDRRSQLDLRQAKFQAGDVSPRERDEYLFLETLLCARERLYLSYLARDELTGEPLEPAPVVSELLRVVERSYLPPRSEGAPSPLVESHALRRYEPRYFPTLYGEPGPDFPAPPAARAEARALALRGQIAAALGGGDPGRDLERLSQALSEPARRLIDEGLCLLPPRPAGGFELPETLRLSLTAVRRFLECPLQEGARQILRLFDDESEDLLEREDEPFETAFLDRLQLLRGAFVESLAREARGEEGGFAAARDEAAERPMLSGRMPTGVFAEVEREGHLTLLRSWDRLVRDAVGEEAGEKGLKVERLRLGGADEHARADATFDPIVLEYAAGELGEGRPAMRVELSGATEPLLLGRRVSLGLMSRKPGNGATERLRVGRASLRGFLDAVALAAAGQGGEAHTALLGISNGEKGKVERVEFAPIGRDEAIAWLRGVVADLFSRVHDYLLTAEAVLAYAADAEAEDFGEKLGEVFDLFERSSHGSSYGPIRALDEFAAPAEDEARAMIARRWGLYFEKTGAPLDARFPAETPAARAGPAMVAARGASSPPPETPLEEKPRRASKPVSGPAPKNVVRARSAKARQGELFGSGAAPARKPGDAKGDKRVSGRKPAKKEAQE